MTIRLGSSTSSKAPKTCRARASFARWIGSGLSRYEMEEEGITGISQSQAAAGMDMDETGAAVVPPEGGAARGRSGSEVTLFDVVC